MLGNYCLQYSLPKLYILALVRRFDVVLLLCSIYYYGNKLFKSSVSCW